MSYAAICATCPTIADCKHAFGKYWLDKSNGGVGCKHPFKGWGGSQQPTLPQMPHRKRLKMPTRPVRPMRQDELL